MTSLWDQSRPYSRQSSGNSAFHHSVSGSAFVQQQRSDSHDAKSAFLSVLSSSVSSSLRIHASSQQGAGAGLGTTTRWGCSGSSAKASLNTAATSSTASVTMANSSKLNRSRSVASTDGTMRKSPRRRNKNKEDDDRKFVC